MMEASVKHNRRDLEYFWSMQESTFPGDLQQTVQMWDKRAKLWATQRQRQVRTDERVPVTLEYLTGRGVLTPESRVADVGCGPGRFAAAFGGIAREVVGFDCSPEMLADGETHVRAVGAEKVRFVLCDFPHLDVQAAGFAGAFDLVFSSMTPAVHCRAGLRNAMAMSRKWCCNISHVHRENELQNRMRKEVFGLEPLDRRQGRAFYSLFNLLFLLGYQPETSFFRRRKEQWVYPDGAFVEYLMEQALEPALRTAQAADAITRWLETQADDQGRVADRSEGCYGRILWDVTDRLERPGFQDPEK